MMTSGARLAGPGNVTVLARDTVRETGGGSETIPAPDASPAPDTGPYHPVEVKWLAQWMCAGLNCQPRQHVNRP